MRCLRFNFADHAGAVSWRAGRAGGPGPLGPRAGFSRELVAALSVRARALGWRIRGREARAAADAPERSLQKGGVDLEVVGPGWSPRASGAPRTIILAADPIRAALAADGGGDVAIVATDRDVAEILRDFEFLLADDAWLEVPGLAGGSLAMRRVRAGLAGAAAWRSNVLLSGDTGAGKTAAARALHALSPFAAEPFVHVDCASLSPALLESELFGHERGAFTGAVARRVGRFEAAGRGTILLDEIAELPRALQAKFLRVLEEREFERVGGNRPIELRARVVAATNVPLAAAAECGRFRSDLLYRLEVVAIALPSLAARPSDIPALVRTGLASTAARLGIDVPPLDPQLCARLMERAWPGNVRQLLNLLERLLVHGRGCALDETVLADLASLSPVEAAAPIRVARSVRPAAYERGHIADVLVASGGNVARAARRLGIPRSTAQYRIERLGLRHLIPAD